ncbi:hypothetical protein UFOVP1_29 [uncultured Caudovirales phage]|uniref:Uncharacterized protein n=1 Tax=uncultured Caudovirales phage TaxID=2100421 RepID=A0A6J5KL14_9CAUD|nr:hypothetical protein UFOVP1_29 [uncultured Caudovirales phage]
MYISIRTSLQYKDGSVHIKIEAEDTENFNVYESIKDRLYLITKKYEKCGYKVLSCSYRKIDFDEYEELCGNGF